MQGFLHVEQNTVKLMVKVFYFGKIKWPQS